jgi:hypothetical protein
MSDDDGDDDKQANLTETDKSNSGGGAQSQNNNSQAISPAELKGKAGGVDGSGGGSDLNSRACGFVKADSDIFRFRGDSNSRYTPAHDTPETSFPSFGDRSSGSRTCPSLNQDTRGANLYRGDDWVDARRTDEAKAREQAHINTMNKAVDFIEKFSDADQEGSKTFHQMMQVIGLPDTIRKGRERIDPPPSTSEPTLRQP